MNRRTFFAAASLTVACGLLSTVVTAEAEGLFGSRDLPVVSVKDLDDLVITPVALEKLPRKIFKVSSVGEIGQPKREDLLALFTAFQAQYTVDATDKIIASTPWKDAGLVEIAVTLQQEPQHGLHLLGSDPANCVFLKSPADCTWTVGEKLHLLAVKAGLQEWTPGGGTVLKSPLYERLTLPLAVAQTAVPTREQFITALRAGQTFDVLMTQATKSAAPNVLPSLVVQRLVW